jgi:excisionase family DNA binding protein
MTPNTKNSGLVVEAPFINPDTSLLVDIRGASRLLGISSWQVRAMTASGHFKIVKVGRKFYFRRSSLLRWAERAEESAA